MHDTTGRTMTLAPGGNPAPDEYDLVSTYGG